MTAGRSGSGGPLRGRYYFGLYHWRERGRRLLMGGVALLAAARLFATDSKPRRALALCAAAWGLSTGGDALSRLLSPPPWHVDVEKYRRLATHLSLDGGETVVDVGCGTGRSLVGLAPALESTRVVGLDVFDDRVILGNAPTLARENAAAAGVDCDPVQGDAARLPVADGAVDAVTACRVLHDLPKPAAESALAEAHRACGPGGTVGVLELPLPHDTGRDPVAYWRALVADAGFDIRTVETFSRGGREYTVVVGDVPA